MHAMTRFHALARSILHAKRMLSSGRWSTPAGSEGARSPLAEARGAQATSAEGELEGVALEWESDLARVARPPRGRLMDLVYERLARELDVTPPKAKSLVFPLAKVAR